VFSLVFQICPQTAISMERAWRELSIDMAVDGPILKLKKKTWSRFAFTSKQICVLKKGIIFISETLAAVYRHNEMKD